MAQFDVYPNPGRQAFLIPYVVSLQNARFDRAPTRLVAALVQRNALQTQEHYFAPHFKVADQDVVLDVFNLTTIANSQLGAPVASLADEESRSKLVRALDEFLSQA